MAHAAHSSETPEERDRRLQAEWDALSPEVQEARRLERTLDFISWVESYADQNLARRAGRDGPLYDGSPGREFEVVHPSVIDYFRGVKERCVEEAAFLRGPKPLL